MRRYWYDGHSELFIYLLDRMEYMSACADLLGDKIRNIDHSSSEEDGNSSGDDSDRAVAKAKEAWTKAKHFIRSFADQASELWDRISAPYTRATAQDVEDFIAADDEEENVDDDGNNQGHQMFDRERAMAETRKEKALAKYYEKKFSQGDGSDSDDEEEEKKQAADDESDDSNNYYQPQPSSASEDDDWVKKIRNKTRKNSLSGKGGKNDRRKSFKKIGAKKKENDSDSESDPDYDDPSLVPQATPITKKKSVKAIFEDSDDD